MNAPVSPETRAVSQREAAAALLAVLPDRSVLVDPEQTRVYECDGLAAYRQMPMIVLLPENEAQIMAAIAVCRKLQLDDPVQARRRQHDAAGDRHGAAGQARAGAARHDRHVQFAAHVQDRQHLLFAVGQGDDHRQLAVGGQAVAFVGTGVFGVGEDTARRQFRVQRGGDLLATLGINGLGG